MEQAQLLIEGKSGKFAKLLSADFNPSEYTVSYTPQYQEKSGASQGEVVPEYLKGSKSSLNLTLVLDGFTQKKTSDESKAADITDSVKKLRALTRLSEELHRPPKCEFKWGSVSYIGYVTNLSIQFTMFSSEGKPIRAKASLTITGAEKNKTALQSPDRTKRHVLKQDAPLYLIAHETYGDCAQWRQIAVANGIRNPRRLKPGTVLKIPPLEPEKL